MSLARLADYILVPVAGQDDKGRISNTSLVIVEEDRVNEYFTRDNNFGMDLYNNLRPNGITDTFLNASISLANSGDNVISPTQRMAILNKSVASQVTPLPSAATVTNVIATDMAKKSLAQSIAQLVPSADQKVKLALSGASLKGN